MTLPCPIILGRYLRRSYARSQQSLHSSINSVPRVGSSLQQLQLDARLAISIRDVALKHLSEREAFLGFFVASIKNCNDK